MLTHDLSERSTVEAPGASAWVEGLAVRPFFQPILDLSTGQPLGYEVLSRGAAPFGSPEVMFHLAKELGALWDLERACRMAALQRISTLPPRLRAARFFLNVSPQILSDPRFIEGFTLGALRELGLDQEGIVIEITEKDSIRDYRRFEELVRHYAGQGFRVSLDDFGSGHSSLVTLVLRPPLPEARPGDRPRGGEHPVQAEARPRPRRLQPQRGRQADRRGGGDLGGTP